MYYLLLLLLLFFFFFFFFFLFVLRTQKNKVLLHTIHIGEKPRLGTKKRKLTAIGDKIPILTTE